jgi:2-polyprenyl-6-methoxyphenol hydroxylase-like FAD-dependent oxidoreductase
MPSNEHQPLLDDAPSSPADTDRPALSVAIVGGGPAGLILAACLRNRGLCATIFEKANTPESLLFGAGVNLMQPALAVLKAEGLFSEVAKANDPSSHFFFHDTPSNTTLRAVNLSAR